MEQSSIRNVYCGTECEDIYKFVSHMSGVSSHMLTLSNGVRILRRKDKLCRYISSSNLSHGLHLHCYVKNLGGDSGDELGEETIHFMWRGRVTSTKYKSSMHVYSCYTLTTMFAVLGLGY